MQSLKEIEFGKLHRVSKILAIVFWYSDWLSTNISWNLLDANGFSLFFILKYNYELSAAPLLLKSKTFHVGKSHIAQKNEVYYSSYVEHYLTYYKWTEFYPNVDRKPIYLAIKVFLNWTETL